MTQKKQYGIKVVISQEMASALKSLPRSVNVSDFIRGHLSSLLKEASKAAPKRRT